jgi:tetratricopeptide (TPR) repeat protein
MTNSDSGWRDIWDFDDLDGTEARFRALLDAEKEAPRRASLLTQLARIEGLRARFDEGEELLEAAEALGGAEGWVLIERGRLRRSSGDGESALPLFTAAFAYAVKENDAFLAGDAAHMAALVGDAESWTAQGVELAASGDEAARYWLGPLLNNVGWARVEAGDLDGALDAFEQSLTVHEEHPEQPHNREIARYAVGKVLRELGRLDEATARLETVVAWAEKAGVDAPSFHAELAECYAAAGRHDEARVHAELALAHLGDDHGSDALRVRLRDLADR